MLCPPPACTGLAGTGRALNQDSVERDRVLMWVAEQTGTFCRPWADLTSTAIQCVGVLEEGVNRQFIASTLKYKRQAGCAGVERVPASPLPPAPCQAKRLKTGENPSCCCAVLPHLSTLFLCAVMQVPLCKCSSASGEGKTCFSSPAWVTSGCTKPLGRVT